MLKESTMHKLYDVEILSILHLILEDYKKDENTDDLVYNLKNLIEAIETSEIVIASD